MEIPAMGREQNDVDVETGSAIKVEQEMTAGLQMGSEPTSPTTNSTLSSCITKPPDDSAACKFGLI
jgi:hypothetical protein